jgi:lipopolysaccharide transport system permease protein/teichoic acid transport system permease protein
VRRRRLIWYLASSTLRKGDGASLLGNLWLVLDPTLQLAIYYVVIGVILNRPEPAFPLFLFAAILPWRWFTMAVSTGTESVRRRGKVMQQIAFPHLILPVAAVSASFGSFIFGLIPLAAIYLFYPERLTPWVLLTPVIMAIQLAWTFPIAILLSALNVFYRDIGNLVKHLLRLGFYLSPALFSYDRMLNAAAAHPPADLILSLNPMAWILNSYRDLFYFGRAPDWGALLIVALASLPFTLISIYVFRRASPSFVKVL